MRHPHCFLLIGLLLLCSTQTIAFAQSGTYQTIPEPLRGYWQFKADNVSDWNGPLIGENFVENYYVVFYAEQIKQEADGSYIFHLRNQKGDTNAGKSRSTLPASKSPTTRNRSLPLHCPTVFIRNG